MTISSVSQHYDNLLAGHYDWMFGVPFEAKVAEQRKLLEEVGVKPASSGYAVDLGCGSGFQSFALQELGYRVLAIDSSRQLLRNVAGKAIETRTGDLRELDCYVKGNSADVVVCMGDTLTHLSRREEVSSLFRSVAGVLRPSGMFVVTYRDLAAAALTGVDRFIPVRSDENRVMTCFLEYEGPDTVIVTDLVHVRGGDGKWSLQKSSYRKLRLSVGWVLGELAAAGLKVVFQRADRLAVLAATR
jgi:SAM-dependent methyltransferase